MKTKPSKTCGEAGYWRWKVVYYNLKKPSLKPVFQKYEVSQTIWKGKEMTTENYLRESKKVKRKKRERKEKEKRKRRERIEKE